MIIASVFLVLFILAYMVYHLYLKEYIEVTIVFKALRKILLSRDALLLKILPDVKNKKLIEKVLNLINERKEKSKISYDDAIYADVELNNELKKVYEEINKMKKNELQDEIFRGLVRLERQIKNLRVKYTMAVEQYNMSLTIHPNVCIKLLHMRPLEAYGNKNKEAQDG